MKTSRLFKFVSFLLILQLMLSACSTSTQAPAVAESTKVPADANPIVVPTMDPSQTNIQRLRQLDFSPFADALAGFTAERAKKVESIVTGADVSTVQNAMSSGDLTSEDLTLFFLTRIKVYDENLRSFVELNPNALKEARAADAQRKEGKNVGPMLGIPVSLKDNIETTAPLHTTGGAEILLNHVPNADAPLVSNLRNAGAVILGKANLSELAGGIALQPPGASAVGGQTANPHGKFSPGGSSSGSGAGTAAYLTMVSVGSETSGSLIVPSTWNGVVGLYPSRGVVDGSGVIPLIKNNDSAGPIGRNVKDVATLLGIIDTRDVDYSAGLDAKSLNGIKAGFFRADILGAKSNIYEDTSDNSEIIQRIEKGFGAAGGMLKDVELKPAGISDLVDQIFVTYIAGGVRYDMLPYLTAAGAPVKTVEDLSAYNLKDPKTRIPFGQLMMDITVKRADTNGAAAYNAAMADLKKETTSILDGAFADSQADILVSVSNYHSSFYTSANYPAISVPLGLRANGMPVGVTLIGKPGEEAKLLSYAFAIEQATKLRVDPKSYLTFNTSTQAPSETQPSAAVDAAPLYIPRDVQPAYANGTHAADGKPGANYWQNRSVYDMKISVTPPNRTVTASEDITYINDSPDPFSMLSIRLYQNSHKPGAIKEEMTPYSG